MCAECPPQGQSGEQLASGKTRKGCHPVYPQGQGVCAKPTPGPGNGLKRLHGYEIPKGIPTTREQCRRSTRWPCTKPVKEIKPVSIPVRWRSIPGPRKGWLTFPAISSGNLEGVGSIPSFGLWVCSLVRSMAADLASALAGVLRFKSGCTHSLQ